jgi:hypothetical protein
MKVNFVRVSLTCAKVVKERDDVGGRVRTDEKDNSALSREKAALG